MAHTAYWETELEKERCMIKMLQMIFGMLSLLFPLPPMPGCFYDGYFGYVSSLNLVCLIANTAFFVLGFMNIVLYWLQRWYSLIGLCLFIMAFGLVSLALYQCGYNMWLRIVPLTLFIGLQMYLFFWDVQCHVLYLSKISSPKISPSGVQKLKPNMFMEGDKAKGSPADFQAPPQAPNWV